MHQIELTKTKRATFTLSTRTITQHKDIKLTIVLLSFRNLANN